MQAKTSLKISKSVKSRWRLLCSPKSGAKSYTKTTIYSIYTLAQVVFSISFLFKDNSGKNLLKLKLQHHKNTSNFPPPLQTRPSTTSALYHLQSKLAASTHGNWPFEDTISAFWGEFRRPLAALDRCTLNKVHLHSKSFGGLLNGRLREGHA